MKSNAELAARHRKRIDMLQATRERLTEELKNVELDIIEEWDTLLKAQGQKTFKEWFETLLEPYRSNALANTATSLLDKPCESLTNALYTGFSWFASPEGFQYWNEVSFNDSPLLKKKD